MKTMIMAVLAMAMTIGLGCTEVTGQAPPVPDQEQPEVLTRGPVNEAFAQPVNLEDQTGLIVQTAPPSDIEEVPPLERPVGEQFQWIPGYWAWDLDRNGYIWVSGCWRAVPPGMTWVPGYWAKVEQGWQWVAGFWAPMGNNDIEYLPAPPALTDIEPPSPAQSPDSIWVPPCWYWYHKQYIHRPGYWIAAQPDWVWIPSHYMRTPRGYIFVTGHWDWNFDHRGILFAPVYFPSHLYTHQGFSYTLSIAVDVSNLEFGLFTRPQYCHYYFGDYYDSVYIGFGIFPWYDYGHNHRWYDPIYTHHRWLHHKDEPQWDKHLKSEYEHRRDDKTLRPPRTYREMEHRAKSMTESQKRHFEIAAPVTRIANRSTSAFKVEQTESETRKQISRHAVEVQTLGKERKRWESQDSDHNSGGPAMDSGPSAMPREKTPAKENRGSVVNPSQDVDSTPTQGKEHRKQGTSPFPIGVESTKSKGYKNQGTNPLPIGVESAKTPSERRGHAEGPAENPESPTTSPGSSKRTRTLSNDGDQNHSDTVRFKTPNGSEWQGDGSSRRGQPSRPADEQKGLR
ncbi:MAG: hypothetical protein V1793_09725 [Pseudomonadota bacterium]